MARTPLTARSRMAAEFISPAKTSCTARDSTLEIWSGRWTNARTGSPFEVSARITARPVLPPAPVMRIINHFPLTWFFEGDEPGPHGGDFQAFLQETTQVVAATLRLGD